MTQKPKKRIVLQDCTIVLALFTLPVYLFYLVAAWGISDYLADKVYRDYVTGPGLIGRFSFSV